MLTDPWFYMVALPAVALFGLTKGGFSGASLPAMPLLALAVPPFTAAAIVLPVLMAQDVVTVYAFRRTFDGPMVRLMLPGAVVGIVLGALTAAWVHPQYVSFGVGVMALIFCLNAWFGPQKGSTPEKGQPQAHDAFRARFWGAASGFTSFVIHAGGPPFSVYALPRQLPKETYAGTAAIFFATVNLMKVPAYLALGQLTRETLLLSAVLLPAAILANAGGIWLVRQVPLTHFYRILHALLFAVSVKLIWDGYSAFAAG